MAVDTPPRGDHGDAPMSVGRPATTIRTEILSLLDGFAVADYLQAAGVSADDLTAARSRLFDA